MECALKGEWGLIGQKAYDIDAPWFGGLPEGIGQPKGAKPHWCRMPLRSGRQKLQGLWQAGVPAVGIPKVLEALGSQHPTLPNYPNARNISGSGSLRG